ncbi:ligand-binding protein SH3 [Candidatus Pacearchaeota archaeon ex4484_26]|nr:MAG: ligand-binding protein SH3 [Candidatus Pacearchaeota archaeon ex4484_26]
MLTLTLIILAFLLSLIPFTELRLAIPLVISLGLNPIVAFFAGIIGNILIIPFIFLFLDSLHYSLLKWNPYKKAFEHTVKRLWKRKERVRMQVNKYGLLALALFVAIPLPVTGAYSGSLIAWLLHFPRRKSILAIALGVFIAGILVTLASVGILTIF